MITIKIDVKKITKSRLYEGAKGIYLDAILIPTPNSEHGDYMIVESITKEERENGVKGVILGNAKNLKSNQANNTPSEPAQNEKDNLPF